MNTLTSKKVITQREYNEMVQKIRQYENNLQRKEMKRIQKQKPLIESLDISVRLYNILKSNGINTINELHQLKLNDFFKMKNFGKKTWYTIKELYKSKGWEIPQN